MAAFVADTPGLLYPLNQTAFDNTQAGVNNVTQPTLLIGQTITPQPTTLTPVTSVPQAISLFGAGSHLCRMFQAYFANDPTGPIYCLPLADGTGATKASGSFSFVGPATGNGTLFAYIAGQLVQVGVASGNSATAIAANLAAAINAMPSLPVTATALLGVVTVTAINGGTLGNDIDLRINYLGLAGGQTLPAGVSVSIVAMSGGATDPLLLGIASLLGDTPMRFVVHPYATTGGMSAFASLMSFNGGRWAPNRKSWGHVWTALSNTVANLSAFGVTNDDPHSTVFAYENGSPSPVWEAAAAYCGACAPSLRAQPNLPLQYLGINFFLPPPITAQADVGGNFSKTTWQTLLGQGLALAQYQVGSNAPMVLRAPTTYQTNSSGTPDQSYFDTTTMYTLMAIADALDTAEAQKWARSLLASDGNSFAPGIPVVTPKSALAELAAIYQQLETDGLVEDASAFLAATTAMIDPTYPNQLDITFAPYIVQGLIQINNTIQFRNYSAAAAAVLANAA
jgi:phage tail sheath gpL-like